MKKFMIAMMAVFFGLSLGLYGETTEQEAQNLQKREQHQNRHRTEKGHASAGLKARTEQSNQGEASKLKNQNRVRERKEVRTQAKTEARQTMKAERTQSKGGK